MSNDTMTSTRIQQRLGALRPLIAAARGAEQEALHREREALKLALVSALAADREAKAARQRDERVRNFAGLMTPLYDAVVARLDPALVRELEAAAVEKQRERDAAAAARRAKAGSKVTAPVAEVPKPAPQPAPKAVAPASRRHGPEVYHCVRRGSGSSGVASIRPAVSTQVPRAARGEPYEGAGPR